MTIFASEAELVSVLSEIEAALNRAAIADSNSFREHYFKAGHLHGYYAIDGHESDAKERALLDIYAERIARIDEALESASGLCSEEDSAKEIYQKAGRYGADEAARRLRIALKIHK
jgi:hypothetical protein